jgi:hypothetical protein
MVQITHLVLLRFQAVCYVVELLQTDGVTPAMMTQCIQLTAARRMATARNTSPQHCR